MNRDGIFKYPADLRPVVCIALAIGMSLVPFFVAMPLWAAAIYWAVLIYVRSYGPYAQHNHGHLPVFNSKPLNHLYDVFLTQATGYPTALWELHHNRGHHRNFLTPELDVARVFHLSTGKVMSQWMYALRGNLTITRDSIRIGHDEKAAGRRSLLSKLYGEMAVQLALTALLLLWNPWAALFFFIIPNLITSWAIWWESYPHHLQVPVTGVYDGSVTVTGKTFNYQTFNIGHHTAHHEKPTLHWSLLPQRTAAIRDRIPEVCVREARGPGHLKPAAGGSPETVDLRLPELVGASQEAPNFF